jgi:Protein of unknown function (DUF2568)
MRPANLGLRFLLELCALAALAYWGLRVSSGVLQWVLGLGAPLAMAVVWGSFMSPKATRPLHDPARLLAEIAIFGLAAAALADADQPALAIALAAAVAVHLILTFAFGQREPSAAAPAR